MIESKKIIQKLNVIRDKVRELNKSKNVEVYNLGLFTRIRFVILDIGEKLSVNDVFFDFTDCFTFRYGSGFVHLDPKINNLFFTESGRNHLLKYLNNKEYSLFKD